MLRQLNHLYWVQIVPLGSAGRGAGFHPQNEQAYPSSSSRAKASIFSRISGLHDSRSFPSDHQVHERVSVFKRISSQQFHSGFHKSSNAGPRGSVFSRISWQPTNTSQLSGQTRLSNLHAGGRRPGSTSPLQKQPNTVASSHNYCQPANFFTALKKSQ